MNTFLEFLSNHYIWFLVISLIIIFALIGYLVDSSTNKNKRSKIKPIMPIKNEKTKIHPSVEAYTDEVFDDPLIEDKNAE